METLREKYNITPTDQRKLAKFLCNKLSNIMKSLGGEDKINLELDKFLCMTKGENEIDNVSIDYCIDFNMNELKIWIAEFKNKKVKK